MLNQFGWEGQILPPYSDTGSARSQSGRPVLEQSSGLPRFQRGFAERLLDQRCHATARKLQLLPWIRSAFSVRELFFLF